MEFAGRSRTQPQGDRIPLWMLPSGYGVACFLDPGMTHNPLRVAAAQKVIWRQGFVPGKC